MLHTDNSVSTCLAFGIVVELNSVGIWNRCREQITGCLINACAANTEIKDAIRLEKTKAKVALLAYCIRQWT